MDPPPTEWAVFRALLLGVSVVLALWSLIVVEARTRRLARGGALRMGWRQIMQWSQRGLTGIERVLLGVTVVLSLGTSGQLWWAQQRWAEARKEETPAALLASGQRDLLQHLEGCQQALGDAKAQITHVSTLNGTLMKFHATSSPRKAWWHVWTRP